MKMNLKLLFCPGLLLLLIVCQNQAMARPISSLQGLAKLLDEDLEHPLLSEETEHEQDDMILRGPFDQQDTEFQWTRKTRDQPESISMDDSAVQRTDLEVSKDLLPFSEIFSPYSYWLHQSIYYMMY